MPMTVILGSVSTLLCAFEPFHQFMSSVTVPCQDTEWISPTAFQFPARSSFQKSSVWSMTSSRTRRVDCSWPILESVAEYLTGARPLALRWALIRSSSRWVSAERVLVETLTMSEVAAAAGAAASIPVAGTARARAAAVSARRPVVRGRAGARCLAVFIGWPRSSSWWWSSAR